MDTFPQPPAHSPPLPPPPPWPPAGRRTGRTALVAIVAGVVLVSIVVASLWGLVLGGSISRTGHTSTRAGAPGAQPVPASAKRAAPAIVDINTYQRTSFVAGSASQRPLGAGSGMILTSTGEVLTNNHVIKGATAIKVTVPSTGRSYPATVVGAAPDGDVALLKLEGASALPTVTLHEGPAISVGQRLVAIGNALGRGGTPTTSSGTVVGLDRSITTTGGTSGSERLDGLIQTDAPIAHGDSGGALVDTSGEVVGIITAGHDRPGRATTRVGFAITSQTASGIVDQIRAGQRSGSIVIGPVGFLGVQVTDLTAQAASQAGLGITGGALVVSVIQGTPAARVGIPPDAAITEIDSQRISSTDALGEVLHGSKPGDVVHVTWTDASGTHSADVNLIEGPAV